MYKIYKDTIALELIKYQNNDDFPKKLTEKIEYIYKEIDNNVYRDNKTIIEKSAYVKEIESLIRSRFNLNVIFDKELHVVSYAAIIPFFGDYLSDLSTLKEIGSNVLSGFFSFNSLAKHVNQIAKERKNILDKLHNKKGYIDLKNARVGGYLSEIKHFLIIDFISLKNIDITPSELTAIILHEIGHAFSGLEYHHKLESTNSTIADILNELNNNNPDKALYIFKKNFTEKEFLDASVSNKKEIEDFYGKIALGYLTRIKTQLGNSKYDETNFENLADSFASRFNQHKELVSALNKHYKRHGITVNNNLISYSILMFIDLMLSVIFIGLFGVYSIPIMAFVIITTLNSNNTTMTYDFPIERYNRIKNSLINNLKNLNLDEKIVKDLIEQYVFINEVIEKSYYFKPILNRVADILISANRDNNYYIKLQQSIENGMNNMLFLKRAQLSVM